MRHCFSYTYFFLFLLYPKVRTGFCMANDSQNRNPVHKTGIFIYMIMKHLFSRFYGFYFFYFMQGVKVGGNRTCLRNSMICYPTF